MNNQNQTSEILITGGTGLLGSAVCTLLDQKKIPYTIATHRNINLKENMAYCNLDSGEGVSEALKGKKTILHLASDKKKPDNDITGTLNLLNKIKEGGENPHLIFISIVGINLLSLPYFKQKLQTENEIRKSGVNYSILRATQFHEYISDQLAALTKLPFIALLPIKVPVQPIDVSVVANMLIELTGKQPSLTIQAIGGPATMSLGDAARAWLAVHGKNKLIINFPLWGEWGRNLKAGALVCDNSTKNGQSWQEWLSYKTP